MKAKYVRWSIIIIAALGVTLCENEGHECSVVVDKCCTPMGYFKNCDHDCDSSTGNCWRDCNPEEDDCCKPDGKSCEHGCDGTTCYTDCNPSDDCCESDGTSCEHGCDGTNCHTDCNPEEDDCCESDEVQQPETNLYWLRCPLGQDFDANTCSCTGTATPMDWCEAINEPSPCSTEPDAGPSAEPDVCNSLGYRLPTQEELMGLLGNCSLDYENYHCDSCAETGANASATCTDMFGFDSGSYWSSSPYGASADRAWYSSFNGYVLGDEKTIVHDIRCVRSGP